uniref:Uncharacterized protein n=1 Tax=termite gut metagenome TaxID=433724 RepID=S0DG92_9ZZZZ
MEELQGIADSILMEGNLLALYERAAWAAGDLFHAQGDGMTNRFGGYLVYHDENKDIKVIFADGTRRDELNCIYEVVFFDDPENPMADSAAEREFTEWESELWTIRDVITGQFSEIEIADYESFSLNHITFPIPGGYRMYLISGTTLNGIFPFGNDYFFDADPKGNIVKWRKMHSRLIAEPMEYEGHTVVEITHSHLLSEPFITPSDVCTFQLYAPYSEVKKLKIYSTALQLYFVYDWAENTITIEPKADL